MHRHAFTARHVADHCLATNRIAAASAIDQQIAVPLNADGVAVIAAKYAAHHAANTGLLIRRNRSRFRRR